MEFEQEVELSPFIDEEDDLMEEFLDDSEMRNLVEDFKHFEELHGVDTHMVIEQLQDNTWYAEFKDEKKVFETYNEVRDFFLNK